MAGKDARMQQMRAHANRWHTRVFYSYLLPKLRQLSDSSPYENLRKNYTSFMKTQRTNSTLSEAKKVRKRDTCEQYARKCTQYTLQFFTHNFIHKCYIEMILVAIESQGVELQVLWRRLELNMALRSWKNSSGRINLCCTCAFKEHAVTFIVQPIVPSTNAI